MENQDVNKFTWVITNFSSLQSNVISSDHFIIDGCKWRLVCYPQGNEASKWFDRNIRGWGLAAMLRLKKLHAKDGGFLENDELKIVVVVNVLDVHEAEESEVETQPLKKIKLEYDEKIMDINGFQVLPSQVDFVRQIFVKHPDIALEFRPKNPHLRKACMNFLLSLIETLCQPLEKLSNEDLVEADNALAYLKDSGFEVDWLENKLVKVKEKKEEEQIGEARIKKLEVELKEFRQMCMDMEALLEIEKENLLAARAPLTLNDVV